jgi:hypothetical protein
MKTFYFFLDTKVTSWYRTEFEIEAKTKKEAEALAINFVKEGKQHDESWEKLEGTEEFMSVKDNNGQATEELRTDEFYEIWDNTQNQLN